MTEKEETKKFWKQMQLTVQNPSMPIMQVEKVRFKLQFGINEETFCDFSNVHSKQICVLCHKCFGEHFRLDCVKKEINEK